VEEGAGRLARASVHRLPGSERPVASAGAGAGEEPEGADVGSSMRAAAPPVQSFAMGRRR
jgi:hypothetical protein